MKNVRWCCWWERGIKANHHNILEITPLSFTTCDQKLIYIVKFQSDDLIFRHPSSMLRAKLARREEKQSTRVLQCTLAQHVCPVDKQTCVRYPWKESVVMRQKNGNNFSSFWIKTQGGHERSKEAAEHLENLWWWDTGIPNAAFLFVPHGSTRFPCPWTDATWKTPRASALTWGTGDQEQPSCDVSWCGPLLPPVSVSHRPPMRTLELTAGGWLAFSFGFLGFSLWQKEEKKEEGFKQEGFF